MTARRYGVRSWHACHHHHHNHNHHPLDTLERIVHEGTVRRIVVKHDGEVVAEFPLAVGVVGAVLAAPIAAIAAIVALISDCTIEVEREATEPARGEPAPVEPAPVEPAPVESAPVEPVLTAATS